MKRILILIIGLIGVAQAQYSPTSAKTRFVNGLALGTKLDSYFAAADSNAIYWRADSALMAKYKGTARALAFSGDLAPYKLISDTFFTNGYTTRARLKQYGDSLGAVKLNISDSSIYFNNVVRTFGTQTVGGNKTFSNDIIVNGLTVGEGSGSVASNSVFGFGALTANTTGSRNTALGFGSLAVNISGSDNSSIGGLGAMTTGNDNVAIGVESGAYAGSGFGTTVTNTSRSIYLGKYSRSSAATGTTNQIVIGYDAIGNGSNTVTIGNSSVTDNYFSGDVNMTGNANGNEANFGFFGTPTPANSVSAAFTNNSATFEALQVKNNGSGKIATFSNSGGIVAEFGNDGKIGVGATVDANFMVYALGAFPSRFTSTATTATSFYSGSRFERQAGANGDGNGISFLLYDNTSAFAEYGYIGSIIESNTSGSQSGAIVLAPSSGGSRTERFRVGSGGNITALGVYNATVGGTNRDVFVDNTGLIGYVSSFRASKKNITPISNTDWLHSLNPVTFNYRVKDKKGNYTDSAYNELEYGLVAEEVEPVNKEMVFYDVDSTGKKQLRGVHYSKLIIPLLAEVKEHKKKLDEQQTIIEALLTRIKSLEAKLN